MSDVRAIAKDLMSVVFVQVESKEFHKGRESLFQLLQLLTTQPTGYTSFSKEIQFAAWYYQGLNFAVTCGSLKDCQEAANMCRYLANIPCLPHHQPIFIRVAVEGLVLTQNYRSAASLLNVLATSPSPQEREVLAQLYDRCIKANFSEKYPFDEESKMCHLKYTAIKQYESCSLCGATFSPGLIERCCFCGSPLVPSPNPSILPPPSPRISTPPEPISERKSTKKPKAPSGTPHKASQTKDKPKHKEKEKKEGEKHKKHRNKEKPKENDKKVEKEKEEEKEEEKEVEENLIVPIPPSEPYELSQPGVGALLNSSTMMTKDLFDKLKQHLPLRLRDRNIKRLFSTEQHGTSWTTFFSKLKPQPHQSQETILILKETQGDIMGMFATEPWTFREDFYGTGECFIFSSSSDVLKVWRWHTDFEPYWQIFSKERLGMGADYALCINLGMADGTTSISSTFRNNPLTSRYAFNILVLELWCFL